MKSDFSYHFQRGRACFNNADFESAVHEYSQAMKIDPTSLNAYLYRAIANEECGDPADTRNDLETIIRLDPKSAQSYFARAMLFFKDIVVKQEDRGLIAIYRKVEELYSRAIELDPDLEQAYYYRAGMRQELGKLIGACEDLDRCIALDPVFPFSYFKRAYVRGEMGDLRGAIRDLEYYLELPVGATRNRFVMENIAAYWYRLSTRADVKVS